MKKVLYLLLDLLLVVIAGGLLFYGSFQQYHFDVNDLARYQCYSRLFWQGYDGMVQIPNYEKKCSFLKEENPTTGKEEFIASVHQGPFHFVPLEYPLITVILFTPPLIIAPEYYGEAYAIWTALTLVALYFIVKHATSRLHGIIFLVLIVIAGWGTALSRFDLYPGAMTFVALMLGLRKRWYSAYALLALATMIKLYPVILVMPLFIAQQLDFKGHWRNPRRLKAILLYASICLGLFMLSLLLSVPGTLQIFTYFSQRPLQIESVPASVAWLLQFLGSPHEYVYSYGSINILNDFGAILGMASSVATVIGILYVYWLQMRKKVDLATSFFLILMVVIATGKVFSPQYLLWVLPIAIYVHRKQPFWNLAWLVIAILTCIIYPNLYTVDNWPMISLVSCIRNFIFVGILLALLHIVTYAKPVKQLTGEGEITDRMKKTDTQEELFVVESK